MKILPIRNYNKPAFRSISCEYKLNGKEMGLYTCMFRQDLDWQRLARFELENFKDKDKVNIIQFAPSDGSEGYTKILSLMQANPLEAEKFFPIQAFDINENIVKCANSGYINLSKKDLERMDDIRIPGIKYFTMFSIYNDYLPSVDKSLYKVGDELTRRIQFNTGDMFEILPKIKDDSNTIILCRNSLDYYESDEIIKFIKQASKVLKEGSLLITGALEQIDFIKLSMRQHGFTEIMKNVYRRCAL